MARAVAGASRTALAALAGTDGQGAILWEDGRQGQMVFDASDLSAEVSADTTQAIYVPPSSSPSGNNGAWVRQGWDRLDARWFGAVGDGVANDGPALEAAIALSKALATNQSANGFYKAGPTVFIPAGRYLLDRTLDITHTLTIEGESAIHNGVSYACILEWPENMTGIRIQAHNTSGHDTVDAVTHNSGSGTTLRRITLVGGYDGTEGEYHGVHAKHKFIAEDVLVSNFQGSGFHIDCTSLTGDPVGQPEGNANCFQMNRVTSVGNRDGIFTKGADANAGNIIGADTSYNRRWGINEQSFLGNNYSGCHSDGNGMVLTMPSTVSYSGNRFAVKDGQEAGASTNPPPATQTDNTWWYFWSAGGANEAIGIPLWSSGMTLRAGGPYRTANINGQNVFLGCYSEGSSGPSQFVYPTVVIGGLHGAGVEGTGAYMRNLSGSATFDSLAATGGSISDLSINTSLACQFGAGMVQYSGFNGGDALSYGHSINFGGSLKSGVYSYNTGGGLRDYWIGAQTVSWFAPTGYVHAQLDTTKGWWTSDGYDTSSTTGGYRVSNTKVVGAQGAAVADATDAASAITQLNLVLARLRAHGLIAT